METLTETHETVRIYVPDTAAETETAGGTVLETLKRRASEKFGGFSTYSARGGWVAPDGTVIHENVTVLEVLVGESVDTSAETWSKVNARWVFENTDETVVMATVDDMKVIVQE